MNNSKRYTAVVIGCGKVGATFEITSGLPKPASHAAALADNPRTELVALVDPDASQLKQAVEYYKVSAYTDPKKCLKELHPDIVVIATPPKTHESLLSLALTMKVRAIVCEKPVSDTLESAKRMIALAKSSDSLVILNHQRRFFPLFQEARKRIAAGELGEIQQITAYYTNGLLNNGTHTADALQFLLNDTASWAIGVQNEKNVTAPFGGVNIDGLIGFTKGTVASVQGLDNNAYGVHDIRLFGTKGALTIGQYGYRFEWVQPNDGVTFIGMQELDWENAQVQFDKRSMLQATTAHVVDCLDGVTVPQSTLEDGYHTMQILEAMLQSASDGGKRISI